MDTPMKEDDSMLDESVESPASTEKKKTKAQM